MSVRLRISVATTLLRGGTLRGAAALLGLWAGLGCAEPAAPEDPRPAVAGFDRFWRDFDEIYPYFDYKRIDWAAGRDGLRDKAAVSTNDSALVAVLLEAVRPLKDVHVWFRRPDGSPLASYSPERAANWNRAVWLGYLPSLGWRQGVTNWGWARIGEIGYLAVGDWNTAQVKVEELDAALEQLRTTRALVLDVRMNGGGDDGLALQLAGRFADRTVRFGAVRYRTGPGHADFGPWNDRVLNPRGAWQYGQPVYLLVGAGCFSSNETFITAMGELRQVTVVGDRTGGGSGNPKEVTLVVGGRDTGWKYSVPRWMEVRANGDVIEWQGITPDVVVPFDSASVARGTDPVLDWALARAALPVAFALPL